MLIGYAHVSTTDQNLNLQQEALVSAGCKKIFEDKVSRTQVDRPGIAKSLDMLRQGCCPNSRCLRADSLPMGTGRAGRDLIGMTFTESRP